MKEHWNLIIGLTPVFAILIVGGIIVYALVLDDRLTKDAAEKHYETILTR